VDGEWLQPIHCARKVPVESPWYSETNTWFQEKLEHQQEYHSRAEGVGNRSRARLTLRRHSIKAPGASLYPDHPEQSHHHRWSDHLEQFARDAERDDQRDRDQCRQRRDLAVEPRRR
jgi:hypothetical protein